MPTSNRLRQRQRDEIHPLIRVLDDRIGHDRPFTQIAQDTGLTNYQVGRLLGETLPSPTYLDLTRLIVYAGMTPNEAARIVGLYQGVDYDQQELTTDERELLNLIRAAKLPRRERAMFRSMLETMLRTFAEQAKYQQELASAVHAGEQEAGPAGPVGSVASLYDGEEAGQRDEPSPSSRRRTGPPQGAKVR